jgi:hypothetical protein
MSSSVFLCFPVVLLKSQILHLRTFIHFELITVQSERQRSIVSLYM